MPCHPGAPRPSPANRSRSSRRAWPGSRTPALRGETRPSATVSGACARALVRRCASLRAPAARTTEATDAGAHDEHGDEQARADARSRRHGRKRAIHLRVGNMLSATASATEQPCQVSNATAHQIKAGDGCEAELQVRAARHQVAHSVLACAAIYMQGRRRMRKNDSTWPGIARQSMPVAPPRTYRAVHARVCPRAPRAPNQRTCDVHERG
jgi:hypothetical protein